MQAFRGDDRQWTVEGRDDARDILVEGAALGARPGDSQK
jgi:hypothetical protein